MRAQTVVQAAQDLLSQVAAQLAAIPGFDVPVDQYIVPGADVAWEREALIVHLVEIGQGQPGAPFGGTYFPASVTNLYVAFDVLLIRNVPGLESDIDGPVEAMLPDPSVLNTAALLAIGDAEALTQAAVRIHAAYTLSQPGEGFVLGPVTTVGPQGLLVGSVLPIYLSVT